MSIACPVCEKPGLDITFNKLEIPYFGEVMESVTRCSFCGYRHADVMALEEKEPTRYTIQIEGEEDMFIRVVRSSYSTVEVPELGVKVTPGPRAEGYVSNIEGVLERIERVVGMTKGQSTRRKQKVEEILQKIKGIREGKEKATLIIEDPSGNSAIISEKALKEPLK
jgi:zinc finger protein